MNKNLTNSKKTKIQSKETAYAKNADGHRVFIEDVETGKQGYFCCGDDCQREMVAVRGGNRQSYFRHHSQDVEKNGVCTYSN